MEASLLFLSLVFVFIGGFDAWVVLRWKFIAMELWVFGRLRGDRFLWYTGNTSLILIFILLRIANVMSSAVAAPNLNVTNIPTAQLSFLKSLNQFPHSKSPPCKNPNFPNEWNRIP
jgi:hypothetical protein